MNEKGTTFIVDNGSGMCKSGFSGDNAPRMVFPTIIGKTKKGLEGMASKQVYVGEQAKTMRNHLYLSNPIEHGVITNWEDMIKIWDYCFKKLGVKSREHPCLLTQTPNNPKKNRERMTQIMFETFEVPAFYLSVQQVLSLHASGRSTGLVLNSGYGVTNTIPIFQGYPLPHALGRIDMAGETLTQYLITLLNQNSHLKQQFYRETAIDIKQTVCYVALDFQQQINFLQFSKQNHKEYKLPDGQIFTLNTERIRCPEALFKPTMAGTDIPGIQELVYGSIMKCDSQIRKDLYNNVVMSGGNTMFLGISERLSKELIRYAPNNMNVEVVAPHQRQVSAWMGGSIFSSLSNFEKIWISKQEYEQTGATIVHQKCL